MTEKWTNIIPVHELGNGERFVYETDDHRILVCQIENQFYAVDSHCTHEEFELDDGDIDNSTITCHLHGAQFCLKTGAVKAPPAIEDLKTYPIQVDEGMVQILLKD